MRLDVSSWSRRIGWLAMIWLASIAAMAIVAGLFRIVMILVGLTV